MSARSRLLVALMVLVVLHLAVALRAFRTLRSRSAGPQHPYAPPMRLHFVDATGRAHLRPFFYALSPRAGSFDEYEEKPSECNSTEAFPPRRAYSVLGVLPLRTHLFGADAPVYLGQRRIRAGPALTRFVWRAGIVAGRPNWSGPDAGRLDSA